jgi:hypothetical protein
MAALAGAEQKSRPLCPDKASVYPSSTTGEDLSEDGAVNPGLLNSIGPQIDSGS